MKKQEWTCDTEKGVCETPDSPKENTKKINSSKSQAITIIYFTDPICSACWGIEPQLRKLKLEYGDQITIEYRMGGLLPDWSYNSGGISKPSDVAGHWDEMSTYYGMPIDGDIWLENPLSSSYPPSKAYKAAQIQSEEKALIFLREIREMVFLYKKNISEWQYLAQAAQKVGLDTIQFQKDYQEKAEVLFQSDLELAKKWKVRGFPTLFLTSAGKTEIIYGTKPYSVFTSAIQKIAPKTTPKSYNHDWKSIFSQYPTLTAKEFSELTHIPIPQSKELLHELTEKGVLEQWNTKNGSIWIIKKLTNE